MFLCVREAKLICGVLFVFVIFSLFLVFANVILNGLLSCFVIDSICSLKAIEKMCNYIFTVYFSLLFQIYQPQFQIYGATPQKKQEGSCFYNIWTQDFHSEHIVLQRCAEE